MKTLDHMGVPYRIVVEPQEYDNYAAVIDPKKIIRAPEDFSKRGQGSVPVRNFVWDHAIQTVGLAGRHWLMDDNISNFFRLNHGVHIPVRSGAYFAAIEDFVDRYERIAFAGTESVQFVKRRHPWPPIRWCTRVYSCTLILNDLDLSMPAYDAEGYVHPMATKRTGIVHVPACPESHWRGKYNEDTDIIARALKKGYGTVLFLAFTMDKATTMTMKGGNTDELYAGDGRYRMAQSAWEQHPDLCRVARRFNSGTKRKVLG